MASNRKEVTMVRVTFADESDLEGNTFLGTGEHDVTITKVEDGKSSTGNPMVTFTFSDAHGRTFQERCSSAAKWKFGEIAMAVGMTKQYLMTEGLETDQLVGSPLKVLREKDGTYTNNKGEVRDNIKTTYLAGPQTTNQATEDDFGF